MSKKTNATLLLMCFSLASFAGSNTDINENFMKEVRKQALVRNGFNADGSPKVVGHADIHVSKELQNQWNQEHKEIEQKGYYTEKTGRVAELLSFENNLNMELKRGEKNKSRESSYLRKDINAINIAYEAKPITGVQTLGFAASGGYFNGYSGFVQFFNYGELGTCAYTEDNHKISLGAVKISEDRVTYDVNGKITLINNRGQQEYGFLYQVEWFDEQFSKSIECASKEFSSEIANKTIELSKMVDTQS